MSIQGLVLRDEPYYNEAGYEARRGSHEAQLKSRVYNEGVVLGVLGSLRQQMRNPPLIFHGAFALVCEPPLVYKMAASSHRLIFMSL